MKTNRLSLVLLLIVILAGCSLPVNQATPNPQVIFTLAAQTIIAEQTRLAPTQELPTATIPPTGTPPTVFPPTASATLPIPATVTLAPTALPTATPQPLPCNAARFVTDVTVPDGATMAPGQTFVKTWRLKNTGTCTWNSAYQLVFAHDNAMGGPANQALTTGTVAPGESLDVSVNLKAPLVAGAYKGYWSLRDSNGVLFGLGGNDSFWVSIVVDPALPLVLIADYVAAESGSVRSDTIIRDDLWVGDTMDNSGSQVFLSFNISSLPLTATIREGALDLSQGYTIVGDPFAVLGCLKVYQQDFIPLDKNDFFSGAPTGAFIVSCSQTDLNSATVDNDFKVAIQAKIGSTRIQFRLQFPDKLSNNNGVADQIRLGIPRLIIKYTLP
jgi:hypothetical protein